MPDPTVQQLFRKWRHGDADSGQEMAQKFSDWYYAITTIRVEDKSGRQPLEKACKSFAQGIASVTRPSTLVDWAHDLLERELQAIGRGLDANKATGGDHPNVLTQNRSPTALIQQVAGQLEPAHAQLLSMAYNVDQSIDKVQALGDGLGGLPFALLEARYALKRALFQGAEVPFSVLPDAANMDRAPISLYEAGRLASAQEMAELEKWLLTDIDLCKDVAEFATFVHALRGGALSKVVPVDTKTPMAPTVPKAKAEAPKPQPEAAASDESWSGQPDPFAADEEGPQAAEPAAAFEVETKPDVADDTPAPAAVPAAPTAAASPKTTKKGGLKTIIATAFIVFIGILSFLVVTVLLAQGC